MFPRCIIRPSRTLTSAKLARGYVVHSSSKRQEESEHSVSSHSALQRQQLEFCCLLCGWDVACKTCPFNWFNFDTKQFRFKQRRRRDMATASETDIHQAMKMLDINAGNFDKVSITQQQVKDAFRAKALDWHPDCNPDPEAETIFKKILEAYELLLAHAR